MSDPVTVPDILMSLITIGIAIVAELLRRLLKQIGIFAKELTVISTTIALCPHCPHNGGK